MTSFTTKTAMLAANAIRIVRPIGLSIFAISLGMTGSPLSATDHNRQESDRCSIAIVAKQDIVTARICDPKAVRKLAQQGRVFEQNQLGMVSMLAIGPGYDPADALKWFERSASKGYAPAQVNLAVMYINGWGTAPNYGVALRWLHEAANQGYARAYYNLGILYQQGQGVTKDPAEALHYFRKGAEAGDPSAQTNLGYMYDSGMESRRTCRRR